MLQHWVARSEPSEGRGNSMSQKPLTVIDHSNGVRVSGQRFHSTVPLPTANNSEAVCYG